MVFEENRITHQLTDLNIYEVSPRDGLQGLGYTISTSDKLSLIEHIIKAGINRIEVGSFVNPKLVPNMADSEDVFSQSSSKHKNCELSILIPNKRGVKRAKSVGVEKINIFMSPSESFNNNNHNDTTYGVFEKYRDALVGISKSNVRVYLSCVFGCPIGGDITERDLIQSLEWADSFGNTIVLSDTTGRATSDSIKSVIELSRNIGVSAKIALHLHHGENLDHMENKLDAAYEMGVRDFDSSISGLGGCPFVEGSRGNLATEELVDWAEKRGLRSGVNRERLDLAISFVNSHISKAKEALQISV